MEQDRRGFLKSAGAAAFGGAIRSGNIRGANDRVNIAFIGVGRRGLSNLNFAGKTPGVNVAAVCDISQPALESALAQTKRLGLAGVRPVQDFREILADGSIDAVCIAATSRGRAYMTVEACKAGKDVWVETPVCCYVEEGVQMVEAARNYKRVVQAGTVQRSSGFFRKAREIVKSGSLGDVTFCRVFQGTRTADWGVDPIDIVQFVFDEAMPLSVAAQGDKLYVMQATYRYAGFVGSYERRTVYPDLFHSGDNSIVFHGTKATLMANRSGYQLSMNHQNAKPVEERSLELAEMNMPHWANFLECIRSRQQPVSDIETCVRSTTTCLLADLACSHATALDWDDKSFTVRQTDLRPFLKAKYGERWRVT